MLKACLLTLLATAEPTLAHIPVLLTDEGARRRLTAGLGTAVGLSDFWAWYGRLSETKQLEAIGPLLNKVRDFLLRPRLRRLLCQSRSTVDLRSLLDEGGILLADLSVGRWGESASALAGSFLVARLWQAALARQAVPENERRDFHLYIDEFQSFLGIGTPFADALSQARALRLSLTLANQHLIQLPREIREAVRSNTATQVVFRCTGADATLLAPEFHPFDAAALLNLPRFHALVRTPAAGAALVRMARPSPPPIDAPSPDEVLGASADRFGRPVTAVDEQLRERLAALGRASPSPLVERSGPST